GIELDFEGNILVADEWNHLIRKVSPLGVVSTLAGNGQLGSIDGPALEAEFNYPWDVVADSAGTIYVMDGYNYTMRKIQNGQVETWVGEAGVDGAKDGVGIQASFSGATSLCMNHQTCEIYVGDAFNNLIRKVEKAGRINIAADFSLPGDTLCIGHQDIFRASPEIYPVYQLYINGNPVATSSTPEIPYTFEQSGSYELRFAGIDSSGAEVLSQSLRLYVVERPLAGFTYQIVSVDAQGMRVQFEATSQAASYHWDFGDPASGAQNTSSLPNPEHLYQQTGTYSVQLRVQNSRMCSDSLLKSDVIQYQDLLLHSAEVTPGDSICQGSALRFEAGPARFVQYEFYLNEQLVAQSDSPAVSFTFEQSGPVQLRAVGINARNERTLSQQFGLFVVPKPKADFSFSSRSTSRGLEVQFVNESTGATHYEWNFGDPASGPANTSEAEAPLHLYQQAGTYDVTLMASHLAHCTDTLFRKGAIIYQPQNQDIFIPSAFSPNGDGLNDLFYVRGQDIQQLTLEIYNEWGELIQRITDPGKGWDGRKNGQLVQPDTYLYVARITTSHQAPMLLTGQVTILR
ncbi:MAG: PKD domain-containing protein, partial [Bacteroidetes bacterium]